MLPIGYKKWSMVPQHYKASVWNCIIEKFEVNDAGHKNYIFKSLGKKWRDYRYELNRRVDLCDNLVDYNYQYSLYTSRDDWYDRDDFNDWNNLDDWHDFLMYRACSDTEKKATQNTRNCKSLTMHHTLGSKSFARLENELKVGGDEPVTRVALFKAGYTKKHDGSFVNEKAKKNHEKLVIQSQILSENDAYISVFGKEHPGYVRGLGLGVVKTQIYGSSSNSNSMPYSGGPTQVEFDAMKEKIKQLEEQIAMLTGQQHTNM
ncbi:uncharacterized protein LOC120276403 [Dioscorea cayenensis subsp. rotundata]|uniref:Uncharacterized protein LOC120276403 n=1 Tax=Dioscorea cayennensis subsp. rotundata TaxID=55577 RepID=A0AB40CLG6_DIOCR|nr:uncharacterized protein LOC120276403 [Dioscorea cayenensis subsp. rotundata]